VSPRIKWGGMGQLDVLVDGRVVFSKKQAGRMPTSQELVALIRR
jgi:predicted Rdx family selenoprotein